VIGGLKKVAAGQWYHLAYILSSQAVYIYVNGVLSASGSSGSGIIPLANTTRKRNYFGRARWSDTGYMANAVLDEIRMYNGAMSQTQVQLDMNTITIPIVSEICTNAQTTTSTKQASPATNATSTSTTTTTSTSTRSTSSTTTTLSSTTTAPSSCAGHYWPIGNNAVTDTITGLSATSLGSPQFVTDRNGVANGAIWVNSLTTAWQLPVDTYYQGDTTVTMWLKKMACQEGNYGNLCEISCLFIINSANFEACLNFIDNLIFFVVKIMPIYLIYSIVFLRC
jgi:hypothetical protein